MFCSLKFGIGDEGQSILAIFLLLLPAALYIMGLMEGKLGQRLFFAGIVVHSASMIQRGMTIGAIPLTEKHDNISFMAFALALTTGYFSGKKGIKDLGVITLPLAALILIIASTFDPINTISPFLKTPWFTLHIFVYFISYGFFGVSACIGLLYLFSRQPDYEILQYHCAIIGWILLSIALVLGSIWFFIAYGTYWLWTSRELWTTLLWFYYGLYLHARYLRGFSGRPAAVIGVLGFVVALFAYFGIGTIIPAPPTQF